MKYYINGALIRTSDREYTRAVRDVVIGVLGAPIYLVAVGCLMILAAFMAAVDFLWPEDPETMTDEEKRRFYGYGKDL